MIFGQPYSIVSCIVYSVLFYLFCRHVSGNCYDHGAFMWREYSCYVVVSEVYMILYHLCVFVHISSDRKDCASRATFGEEVYFWGCVK